LKDAGGEVYAALYELNDPELIEALTSLGKSAHVILANGAFSSKEPDENSQARETLRNAGVEVFDRMVSSGHFAHNKFAVICDSVGKAIKVLSGSTNWTATGLCTQANNGLIIQDRAVAGRFLQQWHSLQQAGNAFPKDLLAANSKLSQFHVDDVQVTTWFAPTSASQDLDYARKLIANAKEGIMFLFFNPGTYQEDPRKETLLQNVLDRHNPKNTGGYDPKIYIRGVVNQEIANLTSVYNGEDGTLTSIPKDAMVPAAIKQHFHAWEDEALRASMVMVHSKVIVIDPFGEYPVLMTGSHNLGLKASQKNDDNLVILEGPHAGPLAAAYAVNIIGTYQTYRWNHYVSDAQGKSVWHGLEDNDKWQTGHLSGPSLEELKFWMAEGLGGEHTKVASAGTGSSAPPAGKPGGHTSPAHKPARPVVRHARSVKA
jgi:phosphatidylserine/phosphatidylglycerophosphate/cardiolipin synthase-like enzyme